MAPRHYPFLGLPHAMSQGNRRMVVPPLTEHSQRRSMAMCSKTAVNWLCGSAQGTATHFTLCVGCSTRGSRQWGKVRNWHLLDSATFGPRGPPCPLQATKFWAGGPGIPSGGGRAHTSTRCSVGSSPTLWTIHGCTRSN
jgi:hypothetical protein